MYVKLDQLDAGGAPLWLRLGLEASKSKEELAASGKPGGVWADHDPRTLHRFARLVRFLQRHYPQALQDKNFKAGSAVLLEFMLLQQAAPDQAQALSSECFGGQITVARMRDLVSEARKRKEAQEGFARASGVKKFADFSRMAIKRLMEEPAILARLQPTRLEEIKTRETLMPRMVAHCNRREIAVEIRAPQDLASRAQANVAASMVARIAVLRMRFDDAVLVMPMSTQQIAIRTKEMLMEWPRDTRESSRTVDVLLLNADEAVWM